MAMAVRLGLTTPPKKKILAKNRCNSASPSLQRGRSKTRASQPIKYRDLPDDFWAPPSRKHFGPTGYRRGLRSLSPNWPTPNRPPSPTGASPEKPILIQDDPEPIATPTISQETSSRAFAITRKSLRLQVQPPVSILGKAKKRAREKGEGSSSEAGIPLLTSFPYNRLTIEQIDSLFKIYNIQLGTDPQHMADIIKAFQIMDRTKFESVIRQLLDQTKHISSIDQVIIQNTDQVQQLSEEVSLVSS